MASSAHSHSLIPADTSLYRSLHRLAGVGRMVFFAGLPGTGKSLLLQQLACIAHGRGRTVHLMQWDVCRRPFEEDAYAAAHYPEIDGVTHGVIRKAVGLWAREAVLRWHQRHAGLDPILIGEAPLVGGRLIELAQALDDAAEPVLRDEGAQFVIPVPSRGLRRFIEGRRKTRSVRPRHIREQADARPHVVHDSWAELYEAAGRLGMAPVQSDAPAPYDPDLYSGVYETALAYRHHERLLLDIRLRTGRASAYDLDIHQKELTPAPEEAHRYIREVERRYPDLPALEEGLTRWYIV